MTFCSEKITVRGYQYHIQKWGDESLPKLFLLHGWMDCGASFKFLAPYLSDSFHLIAPDWRGFGETSHTTENSYWYQDYFADLDVILDYYQADKAVDVIGHSMGGNISLFYASIRPARVKNVLSMEGLAFPEEMDLPATEKLSRWLDQTSVSKTKKEYNDWAEFKASIRKGNPYLSEGVVEELMKIWGKKNKDAKVVLKHDDKHRNINPLRYNHADFFNIWAQAQVRVGVLYGTNAEHKKSFAIDEIVPKMIHVLSISANDVFEIEGAHHMMHMEKPAEVAKAIRKFMLLTD